VAEIDNRFIWGPGDVKVIERTRKIESKTGKKSENMPDLHKKQLKLDAKLFGNQG